MHATSFAGEGHEVWGIDAPLARRVAFGSHDHLAGLRNGIWYPGVGTGGAGAFGASSVTQAPGRSGAAGDGMRGIRAPRSSLFLGPFLRSEVMFGP